MHDDVRTRGKHEEDKARTQSVNVTRSVRQQQRSHPTMGHEVTCVAQCTALHGVRAGKGILLPPETGDRGTTDRPRTSGIKPRTF